MINRHNYEEFFLLYVDGELETAQRVAVENFIKLNPDVAEELSMLQETILAPENFSYNDKTGLHRSVTNINKVNYEEYFLLSVDHELTKEEDAAVEQFILTHPELQEDFMLLQSTQLPVETNQYPYKKELYRSEKERKIIPFGWFKMSAAAILFIVAATWLMQNNNNEDIKNTIANNQASPILITKQPTIPAPNPSSTNVYQDDEKHAIASNSKSIIPHNLSRQVAFKKVAKTDNNVTEPVNELQHKLLPPTKNMMAALLIDKSGISSTPIDVSDRSSSINDKTIIAANNKTNQIQPVVKTEVFKEFDEDEESKSIYIGAAEINRNKLKSIFKKASSLFERKEETDNENDRTINIASFQFKTK